MDNRSEATSLEMDQPPDVRLRLGEGYPERGA